MFSNFYKKSGKEVAEALLNTFKTGLFKTKYYKEISDKFKYPPNLFKDIYVTGFVHTFISLSRSQIYDKNKEWLKYDIGQYVDSIYKYLKFTKDEIILYQKVITDKETQEIWREDGRYDVGREHARLCFGSAYNLLSKQEDSELFLKAQNIAENTPKKFLVSENLTNEANLAAIVCDLTIYDYLQKQFGGVLIGKHDYFDDSEEKKNNKLNNDKIDNELVIPPKFETLEEIREKIGTLKSKHKNELEDIKKKQKKIEPNQNTKTEKKEERKKNKSLNKNDDDNHLDKEYYSLKDQAKIKYGTENIISDIFACYRGLILFANRVSKQNKKSKNYSGLWITLVFQKIKDLTELCTKLEKLKDEDYVYHIKELLLLEDKLTKVTQQKVYNEFKQAKWLDKLEDYPLFKELVLKDFKKLKI